MSDEQKPRLEMVEMRADEAPRDFETELAFANGHIEALKQQMLEMESFNSQLQDTFRLNVAATILGNIVKVSPMADERAMDRAITLADKFVAHYVKIMEANAAKYARMITEAKANETVPEAGPDQGETVN